MERHGKFGGSSHRKCWVVVGCFRFPLFGGLGGEEKGEPRCDSASPGAAGYCGRGRDWGKVCEGTLTVDM